MATNPEEELYQQQGYDIMAACFAVRNEIGHGLLEEIYHESLEIELTLRNIPFISRPSIPLFYKGRTLRKQYEPDLIACGEIILELKAVKTLLPEHEAQLINYLKITRKRVGHLVNFAAYPLIEWRRRII